MPSALLPVRHFFSSAALRAALPALTGTLMLAGCSPEQSVPAPNAAAIDLSSYLAVGDNYTAGYSDGGLTLTGQQYSIPALLDQQFAQATGRTSTFTQPLFPAGAGTGYLQLRTLDANGQPLTNRVTAGRTTINSFINTAACGGGTDTVFQYQRATNTLPQNLGVPFMRLSQIELSGLGNQTNLRRADQFNPFLERLLPANDSRTYLQLVTDASAKATFFTFFMGLGDALPYVLTGGDCAAALPNSGINTAAKKILDKLTAGGRPGIICLAPDNLNQLPLVGRGSDARVRTLIGPNDTVFVRTFPANAVRAMDPRDYLLPNALAQLGVAQTVQLPGGGTASLRYGLDKRNPITRRDVLDQAEYTRVNPAITALNTELIRLADQVYKIPVINRGQNGVNVYNQIASGFSVNGVKYTDAPVRGNFYSLDQYSLTPRGNGIMTNAIIREINRFYGASIPLLDPNTLPTAAKPE
jgi:hypothetical protein